MAAVELCKFDDAQSRVLLVGKRVIFPNENSLNARLALTPCDTPASKTASVITGWPWLAGATAMHR